MREESARLLGIIIGVTIGLVIGERISYLIVEYGLLNFFALVVLGWLIGRFIIK